jgi:hypothetical protein
MIRLALGVVLAAIAMFVWGFVYWGSGLVDPFSHMTAENETALTGAVKANLAADGVYFIPESKLGTPEQWQERMVAGPVATISYRAGGTPTMPQTMIAGFVHMLGTALFLALLLQAVRPATHSYADRLKIVVIAGAIAAFAAHMGQPIWWHLPWDRAIKEALYDFGSFIVAGLVLSYFVTRTKPIVTTS